MRNFKNYTIWEDAMSVCESCFRLIDGLPNEEKWGLRSQMSRAAVSIPSNIAEGSARESDQEFKRYLEIALGSAFELETQLLLAVRVGYLDETHMGTVLTSLHQNQSGINALIQKLKK